MIPVIPRFYPERIPGYPGPLYWADEQSGLLHEAVEAFFHWALGKTTPTTDQVALLKDYCDYWIGAPCWRGVEELRASIKTVCTIDELEAWIKAAEDFGLNPL